MLEGTFYLLNKPPKNPIMEKLANDKSQLPKRVLWVEDNDSLRRLICVTFQLKYSQHTLEAAADGREAIEIAARFLPDVIFVDLGLPDIGGHQLAKQLQAMPTLKDARLIAISGRGEREDIQKSFDHGFEQHIIKPVDFEHLDELLVK